LCSKLGYSNILFPNQRLKLFYFGLRAWIILNSYFIIAVIMTEISSHLPHQFFNILVQLNHHRILFLLLNDLHIIADAAPVIMSLELLQQ
jgi:hypothetical protein